MQQLQGKDESLTTRIAAAAALVAVACSALSADAAAPKPCTAAHAKTVATSANARVYRVAGRTFACWRATGRRFALGDFPRDPSAGEFELARRVTLAGRYAGFELVGDGRSGPSDAIVVRDVSTGRYLHRHPAYEDRSGAWDFTSDKGVSDLALRPDGSIAWIVKSLFGTPLRFEVHKIDSGGHALLDSDDNAAAIKPGSLATSRSLVYWMHGDEARWAPFK